MDDNSGFGSKNQQQHLHRAISENDQREKNHGGISSFFLALFYPFFSCSKAGVSGGDDQPVRRRPRKGKSDTAADSKFKHKSDGGQNQEVASASSQNKEHNKAKKKRINSQQVDGIPKEADMHLVLDHDAKMSVHTGSQDPVQKQDIFKLPPMSETSLLSEALQGSILPALPTLARGRQWTLLYSTQKHGISLQTLYRSSSILPGPCLLVIGDTKGAVFGGLLSAPLKPSPKKKYQGTSETFVFSDVSGQPELYRPTGTNRYFILCTRDALVLGGGGHFALHLDEDLLTGSSGSCVTFGNTCLASSEDFIVKNVELWGFGHSSRYFP